MFRQMSTIKFISIIKTLVQILPHLNDGALSLQETIPDTHLSKLQGMSETVLECRVKKDWFVCIGVNQPFPLEESFSVGPQLRSLTYCHRIRSVLKSNSLKKQ